MHGCFCLWKNKNCKETTMVISIINKRHSKIKEATQIGMVWVAAIIGERVSVIGAANFMLYSYINWEILSEAERFKWTFYTMDKDPKITKEFLKDFVTQYETIKIVKRHKNKSREDIVTINKAEKIIMRQFDTAKAYLKNFSIQNKYYQMIPIMDVNPINQTKPILIYNIEDDNTENKKEEIIRTIVKTIKKIDTIPLIDKNIRIYEMGRNMNNLKWMMVPSQFIYDLLIEMPAPETLITSQLNIIRFELSHVFGNYFDELTKLNEEIKNIPFIKSNFKSLIERYQQKTNELKPLLQKAINNNQLLNQLKTENKIMTKYKLYVGITTFNALFNYYGKMAILSENIIQYAKEDIATEISINNARLFLFMGK